MKKSIKKLFNLLRKKNVVEPRNLEQEKKNFESSILDNFKNTISDHPNLIFQLEDIIFKAQGKGFGGGSIQQENEIIHRLLIDKPRLAIDIGGNIGDYSAELRARNPDVEIHIFEPDNTNLIILNDRFTKDDLIVVAPYAVSNSTGNATLYADTPGSALASLTKRNLEHISIDFENKQNVSTIRFEDYWKNVLSSRLLDIVKIDIEGHELDALNGFGSAIESVKVLQFEFGGCNIDTRTFFQDFWYFFKQYNFDLYRITPYGMEPISRYREVDEFYSTTNYIARNTRL